MDADFLSQFYISAIQLSKFITFVEITCIVVTFTLAFILGMKVVE